MYFLFDIRSVSPYFISHLWNKRRVAGDSLHNPRWRQPLFRIKSTQRGGGFLSVYDLPHVKVHTRAMLCDN